MVWSCGPHDDMLRVPQSLRYGTSPAWKHKKECQHVCIPLSNTALRCITTTLCIAITLKFITSTLRCITTTIHAIKKILNHHSNPTSSKRSHFITETPFHLYHKDLNPNLIYTNHRYAALKLRNTLSLSAICHRGILSMIFHLSQWCLIITNGSLSNWVLFLKLIPPETHIAYNLPPYPPQHAQTQNK